MKLLINLSIFILTISYINCHCLFQDTSHRCLITENLADQKWIEEICVTNKSVTSTLSIVSVLKNELKTYRTLEDFCQTGAVGRLSWINYNTIIEPLLNSKGVNMDIPRVSRVSKDNAVYLQSTDHALDEGLVTEILVENLPLRYELRNIKRTAWENVTKYETVTLENIYLRNDDEKAKILTKNPLIVTNHSIEHVFPASLSMGSEMRLYDEEKIIRIVVGSPRPLKEVRETIRISKRLGPNVHTSVKVEGTLAKIWFEITGDLTLVYEDFKEERLIQGQVIESKTIDIKQIGAPISKIAMLYDDSINKVEDPGARYRAFKIVAVVACVFFFGVCIVAFTDVIRYLLRTRREKRKNSIYTTVPFE